VRHLWGLASLVGFRREVNAGRYLKMTLTKIIIERDDSSQLYRFFVNPPRRLSWTVSEAPALALADGVPFKAGEH
jgi:hypothetical protein